MQRGTTMNYTLAAAAKSVGMNTIFRVIKSGRITSSHDVEGGGVEGRHVLPAVAEQRCEADPAQEGAALDDVSWRAEFAARIALAEQRLADLKTMLEEMRTERNAWREQAQRLALPKHNERLKTGWWRRVRSAA
jgi:hypothetical protein